MNVLEMEGSGSRLLEKSSASACIYAFSYVSLPYVYYCWFRWSMYLFVCFCVHIAVRLFCACVIHLFHTHTDVIVDLFINSSMYIWISVTFALFS